MSIKTITINDSSELMIPEVRLQGVGSADIWQYVGSCIKYQLSSSVKYNTDLNQATQEVANVLSKKLSPRSISIEVLIDPLTPVTSVSKSRVKSMIEGIGENASAAVEPGPGSIILKTWWKGGYAGVDAIAVDAAVPDEIMQHLMEPGFSTRAGEWDTGFGLYLTREKARAYNGMVEFFKALDKNGVGFRLALPVNVPSSPGLPEAELGLLSNQEPLKYDYFNDIYLSGMCEQLEV